MIPRKARRTWFHLGCSIVFFTLLAASAAAEEPIDRRLAAGPDRGAPGGAIPPARPGSLNAVPDPKLRVPLTPTTPAAPETVLTTKGFTFAGSLGATDTEIVQFPVPGPGKVAQPAGRMPPAANIVGQPASASQRQGIPIQKEIMGSAAAPQKKFSPQSITLPVTLEMTGMKFRPQSIPLPVTLEMTGMKFRPQSISLPVTLEMTGMNTKREVFEKPPIKMLPSLLEKRNLP